MGKALAKLLSRKGANIVVVARDEAKLAAAIGEIKVGGQRYATVLC